MTSIGSSTSDDSDDDHATTTATTDARPDVVADPDRDRRGDAVDRRPRDRPRHERDHRRARRVGTRAREPDQEPGLARAARAAELRTHPHQSRRRSAPPRSRWPGRRRGTRSPRRRRTPTPRASPPATARSAGRSRSPSTRSRASGSVRSTNIITDTTTTVAAHASVFVAAGGRRSASRRSRSDDALATGAHSITVSQASSAATKNGDSALAGSTVIDGTNDTLQLSINGTPTTLTLAHGTYTATQLAQAVQDAATSAGAPITASPRRRRNALADHDPSGNPGDAAGHGRRRARRARRCRPTARAHAGTDGVLQVDGGANQTFSSLDAGQSITLNAAAGTITATLAGGLDDRHRERQQRQHRRRQPRDRRRQHQRRRRGRDRDRGAGRPQHVPAAAHVEHRGREQRREHRRVGVQRRTSAASSR